MKAKKAKVEKLIYTATIHQNVGASHYTSSKKEAEHILKKLETMNITILRLPFVYGEKFSGKLSFLNGMPHRLARYFFKLLAAFKVTLHISALVDCIDTNLKLVSSDEVMLSDKQENNLVYAIVRRALDISFALSIIVVFWWLLLLVWFAVKMTSKGPGIFVQQRVGLHCKPFFLYKFRTMLDGTEQVGSHEIKSNSVTKIGRFLRKTKIDELPQVFNILQGNMSLIGPRPCLLSQYELVEVRSKCGVYEVLPGITGYSQVKNIDMSSVEHLAKEDEKYIKIRTLTLDFQILVSTVLGWKLL